MSQRESVRNGGETKKKPSLWTWEWPMFPEASGVADVSALWSRGTA